MSNRSHWEKILVKSDLIKKLTNIKNKKAKVNKFNKNFIVMKSNVIQSKN